MKLARFLDKVVNLCLVVLVYPLSLFILLGIFQGVLVVNLFEVLVIISALTWSLVRTAKMVAFYIEFKSSKKEELLEK